MRVTSRDKGLVFFFPIVLSMPDSLLSNPSWLPHPPISHSWLHSLSFHGQKLKSFCISCSSFRDRDQVMVFFKSWFSSVSSSGSDDELDDGPKSHPFDGPASSSSLLSLSCLTLFGNTFLLSGFEILDCCNQSRGQRKKKEGELKKRL